LNYLHKISFSNENQIGMRGWGSGTNLVSTTRTEVIGNKLSVFLMSENRIKYFSSFLFCSSAVIILSKCLGIKSICTLYGVGAAYEGTFIILI